MSEGILGTSILAMQKEGVTRNRVDYANQIIDDSFWDDDGAYYNDFPQFLAEVLSASPTASACLTVIKDFIEGQELAEDVGEIVVNYDNGTTNLDDLNKQISNDLGYLGRCAILVKYKFGGVNPEITNLLAKYKRARTDNSKERILAKIDNILSRNALTVKSATLHYLPAEYVRFGIPDRFGDVSYVVYNPYLDTTEESQKTQERKYPLFNPDTVQEDYVRFQELNPTNSEYYGFGQVLFYNRTDETDRVYSKPEFVSAKDAMLAEKEIFLFHLRNIQNNFLLGGFLNAYGNPNQPLINRDGEEDKYRTVESELKKQVQETFAGAKNAGAFVIIWNRLEGQEMKFTPFANNSNDTKFLQIAEQIRDTIITATQVPPILAGVQIEGKLGDSKEKTGAILYMNNRVESYIKIKDRILTQLVSLALGVETKVETIFKRQYEELPEFVFNALPQSAKNEFLKEEFGFEFDNSETIITNE